MVIVLKKFFLKQNYYLFLNLTAALVSLFWNQYNQLLARNDNAFFSQVGGAKASVTSMSIHSFIESRYQRTDLVGKTVDQDGGSYRTFCRDTTKAGKFNLAQLFRSPVTYRKGTIWS